MSTKTIATGNGSTNSQAGKWSQSTVDKVAAIGFLTGILCMVALMIVGLIQGKPQLVVIATSVAAAVGASWATVTATKKKKTQ